MSSTNRFSKFANEKLSFAIAYAKLLANENDGDGDSIAVSAWTITPSGLTQESAAVDTSNTRALIRVSGGTIGTKYTLENKITLTTTADDIVEQITIEVK